ncbi:NAD-dependent epimerase/dehydratase family protein [Halobacillus litoralis]|uniref:NAD-dependent epimerase/dehydratase family protein n=1 Tax=Halobacillus litoralis TaxID=45668 RepID=A0A845E169_9BACI|nr:SDR family oxidoreductase [Halobacillus litoralis]MYL49355.1 NAD-dependent epimerase/dehydratase family protein [Halobacillus litoralis]
MGYKDLVFPKGSKFLVTGSAGFIGSNLVEAIVKMGYEVRGIDNFSTGKHENVEFFYNEDRYEFIEGDIRDFDTCLKACEGVDYILHQAALGSVPRSVETPLIYEDNNIKGTHNIMEAARKSKRVKRIVYASSSAVYGDSSSLPKIEGQEGQPLSPYAVTKKVNELYANLYTELYGVQCIGLRYFNVYGRRQDPHSQYAALIPLFAKKLLNNESPTINGDGEQSRDFTYIDNVIEANLKACIASEEACGYAYNVAFGESYSLNFIYPIMKNLLNKNISPEYGPNRKGDIKHSLADISNAKKYLNYDPQWNFHDGFENALNWYKVNL